MKFGGSLYIVIVLTEHVPDSRMEPNYESSTEITELTLIMECVWGTLVLARWCVSVLVDSVVSLLAVFLVLTTIQNIKNSSTRFVIFNFKPRVVMFYSEESMIFIGATVYIFSCSVILASFFICLWRASLSVTVRIDCLCPLS